MKIYNVPKNHSDNLRWKLIENIDFPGLKTKCFHMLL